MRRSFPLAALASLGLCATSSAALAQVSGVTASANGWDTRTSGYGCAPDGCVADNVLDDSIDPESRWSCRASRSNVDVCRLTLVFDEPQDVSEIRMAMFKGNAGDGRIRTVDIWVDGVLSTTVETSGTTLDYEPYELIATQATTIVLEETGLEGNVWLSITGVKLMTDYEVDVPSPSPAPSSDDYVGCYNDLVGDRVLTTVTTDDTLTPAGCAATCGETGKYFYGLQQGNECWCAGCDITERDTNTDFDRHGDGICSTPCGGDSASTCGGDMAISLFQTTTCLATPAPTPAVPSSECPTGSSGASLEITASWEDSYYGLRTHVVEPGGVDVNRANRLGDVGVWSDGRNGLLGFDNPGTETYTTLNGLSANDDSVLGDYEIWGTASEGTKWTIAARSGGELLWTAGGVFSEFQDETERMIATVTNYADSDCTLDAYECPEDTYGSGGSPPCTTCVAGLVSKVGSTYCTAPGLKDLDLPENIASAMVADAVGGWAGPGRIDVEGAGNEYYKLFTAEGAEAGTITVSGYFAREDRTALPASTALYLYVHNEDSESDFVRGQGEIDATTGYFTATITDFPIGYSRGILSFVLLDPNDGADYSVEDTVIALDVVNEGCSDALRIKLEWDTNDDLDLWVTDPNGDTHRVRYDNTDIGYVNNRNGGGWSAGNPDTGLTSSFEEYVVFSGLSGSDMLGEYSVFAKVDYAPSPNSWTLTATIGGEVVWTEEGNLVGTDTTMQSDDDTTIPITYYDPRNGPQSDVFTITLGSYDAAGC